MAPHLWRFWYQWLILSPGARLPPAPQRQVRAQGAGRRLDRREAWDEPTLRAFADNLAEPARARAAVQMYRVFNLREVPAIMRGRYARAAPDRSRPGCSSAPTTRPCGPRSSPATSATPRRCEVELVDGCGHFIADERPDLVADRAREFFA